ncbi:MAG TPA: aldehyde ferredoxin oxidoreductase N-terminal domain-containing protein [Methanomassiliicoccales archaeon]|nr:aldehyde ferredoxin oxidoreductase N-terminal domain-containing protein [Methanomassiliicoccales archaeon]
MDTMYTGSVLVVDLARVEVSERELDDERIGSKLGGAAVNLSLFEEFKERDPVIIGSGLFTGSMVPGCALGVVTARSPLNGMVMHSPLVNYLGAELKLAGFPFVVLHGKSENPCYLWLHDEIADLLPAQSIWGQDTWRAVDYIREEQGEERIQVLAIGRAGENRLDAATAVVDYWSEGDKIGLGRRMGEMNLKAVATRGMGELEVEDPTRALELCRRAMSTARSKLKGAKGIDSLMPNEDFGELASIRHRDIACSGCPWPCRTFVKYNEPPTVLEEQLKEPGVLVVDASGFLSLMRGRSAVEAARLLETCSRLGLEPIAASGQIAGMSYEEAKSKLDALCTSGFEAARVPPVNGATRPDAFSPFAPNGGTEEDIALAYVLGICPRYVAKVGLDLGLCSELIEATTGLSKGREDLLMLANSIIP